jgi:diguanylate cyclase (GGDEF)-like protein/PAS domain S-box-containing protein
LADGPRSRCARGTDDAEERRVSILHAPLSVLLVEDGPTEAELAARELQRAGVHCVFMRVDTEKAFRASLASAPDLIISDFALPHFDGMSALRIARTEAPEIPFIILSGTLGEERAIEALRSGATDYVLKGNLARLAPAITRALAEAEGRRTARQAEQRFRDLVQTSQDWVWELDVDGHYRFSSPGLEHILGLPASAMLGSYFLERVHEEDQVMVAGAMRSLDAKDQRLSALTARWQHKDRSYRWLERQALAVIDARGLIMGYRGTDRDITERKRQEHKSQGLNRIYRMMNSVNAAVLRVRERAELFEEVCRIAYTQGEYANSIVMLAKSGTGVLQAAAFAGEHFERFRDITVPIRARSTDFASLTEQAMCTGMAAHCNDLTDAGSRIHLREDLLAWGLRSAVALPLTVDGTTLGTVSLFSRESGAFGEEEISLLGQMTGTLSFALQFLEKEGQAKFLAYFDPMTGLARRSLFAERLSRELTELTLSATPIEVLVLDIQRLAAVNDRFGRHGGDQLLQLVAERLKGAVREPTRLAYFGNGLFGILSDTSQAASSSAERLRQTLSKLFERPFPIEGQQVPISAWIGAAGYPEDGANADSLLQNAEHAVKKAKESGEKYLRYVRGMSADLYSRMTLEHQLRVALDERQFILQYQPKISLSTGKIEGGEALLRWQRLGSGLVAPGEFIPVLEETGLIVEVGEWVIEETVRVSREWIARGLPAVPMAVNVSPIQLKRPDFVQFVLGGIERLNEEGGRLDIEITESALMGDVEGSTRKLEQLVAAGMQIAIDDFGTGYSSLSRLAKLPVHALKIDRSFIANIAASEMQTTLISTIISLARSFHLLAIAEGVETEPQRQLLARLQCDQYQGFLYAKPLSAEDFRKRLELEQAHADPRSAPAAR